MLGSNLFKKESQCLPITSHFMPKGKAKLLPVDFQLLIEPQTHIVQATLAAWQFSKLCHYKFSLLCQQRSSQGYGFSNSHVWMWELDYKESWALKNWCFWTVASEKTLESPLDCKEIKQVHPKGNQSWTFIERSDAKAEAPIFWPSDTKNWLIGTDPDAGKDWGQEEKGMTEGELFGWHHWLNGHEFE